MPIKIRETLLATLLLATIAMTANAAVLIQASVQGGNWDGTRFSPSITNVWSTSTSGINGGSPILYINNDFDRDFTTGLLNTEPPLDTIPSGGVTINGPVFNGTLGGDGFFPGPLDSPSDPYYALILLDGDNEIIRAIFETPQPGGLGIVQVVDSSDQFDFLNFTWLRLPQIGASAVDRVSGFAPTPGGSPSDYVGLISLTVVPETNTFVLSVLGLLGLGVATWRKKHRVA
jgi:hypothetical protein